MEKRKKFERMIDIFFYFLLGIAFVIFPKQSASYSFYAVAVYFTCKGLYLLFLYQRQKEIIIYRYLSYIYFIVSFIAALFGRFGHGIIQLFSIGLGIILILFGIGSMWYNTKYIPQINSQVQKKSKARGIIFALCEILIGVGLIIVASVLQTAIFIAFGVILILSSALGFYLFLFELKESKTPSMPSQNTLVQNAIETEIIEISSE